jgi:hypothetical protein
MHVELAFQRRGRYRGSCKSPMRALNRSNPFMVCAVLDFVGMSALGFLPLFGGPGYEIALAAGLLVPILTAVATAFEIADAPPLPSRGFVRGLETGAVYSLIAYLTVLIHGLRAGFCDARSGTALFVLGPFAGSLLAGVWGAAMGEIAGRVHARWRCRFLAIGLAAVGPLSCIGASLWRFYSSPMVYSYDPFFGFFSGTLYDTVVTDSLTTLVTYRAGTLATIFAYGAAVTLVVRNPNGRLGIATQRHPGVLWLTVAAALFSLVMTAEGARLGHWQSADTVAEQLGGRMSDDRCDLVFPRSMREDEAQQLLRDCSTQAREVSSWLGLETAPRVTVYVFANARQRRALMGAGDVSIAKPWRLELYIQPGGYPHPVIGHELVHVLAGVHAKGPFRVPGSLGGLWPNPGLIEGMAEAASADDDALTPQQWSAAMLKLGLIPPLSKVFSMGFLGDNAPKAYTVAGAFVAWVRDAYSAEALWRWYANDTLEVATGRSLHDLENTWLESLRSITIDAAALEYAKARFDRPGVFQRRCPHAVDALIAAGDTAAAEGDCTGAAIDYGRASLLDGHNVPAKIGAARCLARLAGAGPATDGWQQLAADPDLPTIERGRALEALADLMLVTGQRVRAIEIYENLLKTTFAEDRLRVLEVKARAAKDPRDSKAVGELLVGNATRGPNAKLAYALLGQWMGEIGDDGMPAYLIGRFLANDGLWPESAVYLDEALRRRLPPGRVMREVLRQRIIVACAERDEETARAVYGKWRSDRDLPEIRWRVLEQRLGSCIRPAK